MLYDHLFDERFSKVEVNCVSMVEGKRHHRATQAKELVVARHGRWGEGRRILGEDSTGLKAGAKWNKTSPIWV